MEYQMLRELRVGDLGSLSVDIYLLRICLPGIVLKFWGYKVHKTATVVHQPFTQRRKHHKLFEFWEESEKLAIIREGRTWAVFAVHTEVCRKASGSSSPQTAELGLFKKQRPELKHLLRLFSSDTLAATVTMQKQLITF